VTTFYDPPAPARALCWETELFSTKGLRPGRGGDASAFNGVDDLLDDSRSRLERLTARAAYQEVLFGRATLVDIRPQGQREQEGEVDPDLAPVVIERNVLEWRLDPRHPSSLPIADLGLRVILICQEGYASSLAADVLLRLGIHRSTDIIGGFAAWRGAGLPYGDRAPEPGQKRQPASLPPSMPKNPKRIRGSANTNRGPYQDRRSVKGH
jgi:rhodanese-related sulfurtransferase